MTSSIQGECKEQLFVGILQFNIWELELGGIKEIMLFDISHWNNFLSNSITSIYGTKFQFRNPKSRRTKQRKVKLQAGEKAKHRKSRHYS